MISIEQNNNNQFRRASLEDFKNFHGMLCNPVTASDCIQEFRGGTILFMPNHYCKQQQQQSIIKSSSSSSFEGIDKLLLSQYDCSSILNIYTYYLLVLITFTGLSTLLGRTQFLVGREEKDHDVDYCNTSEQRLNQNNTINYGTHIKDEKIVAESNPDLVIDMTVIEYILRSQQQVTQQCHDQGTNSSINKSNDDKCNELFVKRRFEYNFEGIVSVMMIHLGQQREPKGEITTHLVEVYHIQNSLARLVMRSILSTLGWLLRGISKFTS